MESTELPIILEHLPVARRSLRVAVVTETYPPEINGVATTIARFVQGLCERGHDVQLARPRQDRADQAGSSAGYGEVLFNGMTIPRYPSLKMGLPSKRALLRLWTLRRPDLVHVVTEGPLGWSALQAALQLKLPVCSDFRTNFHAYSRHYGIGWLKKPIAAYLRKFHNRTLLTMVPTEAMRRELALGGFLNLRVVARGVDTQLFDPARRSDALRRQWGVAPGDPVAIHVGRLAPEKNLPVLTAAFEAMRRREPRARLVLVGEGPAIGLLRQRCPDAVFAGIQTGEALATHYASGDIFLFPSLTETYGNVTPEAMASGLAIVAYNYAAAAEHLVHDASGLLAHYDDAAGFTALAAALVTDPIRIRGLGLRARAKATELDWGRVVQALESLYCAVAQSGEQAAYGKVIRSARVDTAAPSRR
jgi:glycosyltransferase involved in cell wall biosynthesis